MSSLPLRAAALLATALPTSAQLNDQWAEFTADPSLISAPAISSTDLETDLAWGDLDQNGAIDLVVARVEPIMAGGKRTNMLLMNEGGVLTDRTTEFASASDVVGDMGFLTPTADRDVEVADLNNDGWLDVVTAVGFGLTTEATSLSHPRVYINLGEDVGGNWLGLRYEESRIPVLLNTVTGLPVAGRFNAVAVGDVNNDGLADLYFGDHDASPSSPFGGEPATLDTDDRLLINNGSGFFSDLTVTSLTAAMVNSNFSNAAEIADFNGDGQNDILKVSNTPARVNLHVNDPGAPGSFTTTSTAYSGSPYFVSEGDLNGDGRLDVVVSENGNDGVLYNTATNPNGTVSWSPLRPFDFLVGGDDSFASNSLVSDLDGDGLNDVLIADVDPQVSGFTRRLHIYHNRGADGLGGSLLREERESSLDTDWIGFVGPTRADLRGTHDIAVFDVDGDSLDDVIISRRNGTVVWRREPHCQEDLGFGLGGVQLEVCGNKLSSGNQAELRLTGAQPNSLALLWVSLSAIPVFIPEIQGTLVALPPLFIDSLQTDANGEITIPINGGGGPLSLVVQFTVANGLPTLFTPSNGVQIELLP